MKKHVQDFLLLTALGLSVTACAPDQSDLMTGTIERDRIELKSDSSEAITKIYVTDGQSVTAGDIVFEQDGRRLQSRLDQLRAEFEQAEARLAELQRGPRPEAIREARAKLETSRVRQVNAEKNYHRARDIFDRKLSDQATLDGAQALAESTSAQFQADRAALESLLNGTTAEELAQADAAKRSAAASVAEAVLNLQMLTVAAPADGTVDKVLFEEGERPGMGETVAVLLAGQHPYARIYVPEPLRTQIKPGTTLRIYSDDPAVDFTGRVRWVSADPSFTPYFALTEHDRSRLSYLAEVDIPGADAMPSGLPVFASFPDAQE